MKCYECQYCLGCLQDLRAREEMSDGGTGIVTILVAAHQCNPDGHTRVQGSCAQAFPE